MNRVLFRIIALLVVTVVAVGAGIGPATAAEGDRSRVPKAKLTQKPFRGITLITVGDRVVCTGFVIGANKVATAAHCLVRRGSGQLRAQAWLARSVRVYRGFSQAVGGSAYRACGVSKVWAHAKFVKGGRADKVAGSEAHDYAVLTTKCRFPKTPSCAPGPPRTATACSRPARRSVPSATRRTVVSRP